MTTTDTDRPPLEEPLALYFIKHEIIWKPAMKMCGFFPTSLEQ